MIYNVHYYNLRNNELLQFLNDVLKVCSQYSTEPMKLTAFIAVLLADTEEFDSLFKLDPGSPVTQELIDLDYLRDNCLKGIHGLLEAYCYHYLPETQSAAKLLIDSMDKYGKKLYQLNYPAETSTINSLSKDWKSTPSLANAITLLALDAWVTELVAKNNLFNDKYISRAREKSSEPQVKTFDARIKVITSYKNLIGQIEAGAKFLNDNSFDSLINLINELIVKYNIIADSHTGEEEEETEAK